MMPSYDISRTREQERIRDQEECFVLFFFIYSKLFSCRPFSFPLLRTLKDRDRLERPFPSLIHGASVVAEK